MLLTHQTHNLNKHVLKPHSCEVTTCTAAKPGSMPAPVSKQASAAAEICCEQNTILDSTRPSMDVIQWSCCMGICCSRLAGWPPGRRDAAGWLSCKLRQVLASGRQQQLSCFVVTMLTQHGQACCHKWEICLSIDACLHVGMQLPRPATELRSAHTLSLNSNCRR